VLGGEPRAVPEENRVDLASLLIDIYGSGYAAHPRLENLLKLNAISPMNFLGGEAEARAFEAGEYVRLHQSTLRKVDVFVNLLNRLWDGTLRTKTPWYRQYGMTVGGIVEAVTDHWAYKALGFIGIVASLIGLYFAFYPRP
jgi:hypothetical protein